MAEDEGRFGRVSIPRRAWAPPGVGPHAPHQLVREYTHVYAAVAPAEGKMTSLILPSADTEMMSLFLEHVSKTLLASLTRAQDSGQYATDCSACLQSRAESRRTCLGRSARKAQARIWLWPLSMRSLTRSVMDSISWKPIRSVSVR